jgi:hypothetical protein
MSAGCTNKITEATFCGSQTQVDDEGGFGVCVDKGSYYELWTQASGPYYGDPTCDGNCP